MKDQKSFNWILKTIHNYIYANEGMSQQQAFSEVVKILFIKIFDEKNSLKHFFITDEEFKKIKLTGKSESFELRMRDLFWYVKKTYKGAFSIQQEIELSYLTLAYIIKKIQDQYLSIKDEDLCGLVYQQYISDHQKGERGQFFTPLPVVKLAIGLIDPGEHETVIDPACGSGSFLVSTVSYLKTKDANLNVLEYSKEKLRGYEINASIVSLAKMAIVLSGGDPASIQKRDSLKRNLGKLRNEKFDLIMTNPPFGIKGRVEDRKTLSEFDLAHQYIEIGNKVVRTNKMRDSQTPEILFIEKCVQLTKKGGRGVILLPNGILMNKRYSYVRSFLKLRVSIDMVVQLPEGTFSSLGTTIKTSLLFYSRKIGVNTIFAKATLRQDLIMKIVDEFMLETKKTDDRLDYEFNRPFYREEEKKLKDSKKMYEVAEFVAKNKIVHKGMVYYVEVGNINPTYMEIDVEKKIKANTLPERGVYILQEGDLLIAKVGNFIGTQKHAVAYVDKKYQGAIASSAFSVLRNFKIDPFYLLYFLKSKFFLQQLNRHRSGSLIPFVKENDIKEMRVEIPSENEIKDWSNKIRKFIYTKNKSRRILANL